MCLETREREGEGIASMQGKLSLLLIPIQVRKDLSNGKKGPCCSSRCLSVMLGTCPPLLFLPPLTTSVPQVLGPAVIELQ